MVSFLDALRNAARRAYCSQVSNTPQWFSNLRSVVVPGDYVQRGDNLNKWICGPDIEPIDPVAPQFTGGQCVGAVYRMFITVTGTTGTQNREIIGLQGPVGNGTVVSSGGQWQWRVPHGGFTSITAIDSTANPEPTVVVTGVTRDGGLPDDCGDPEPVFPPPGPIEVNVDINYENVEGDEFSLTVPLIFAPVYVALDGTLRIPIRIDDLNLNGDINLNNDFEVNIDLGNNNDPGGTDNPGIGPGNPGLDGEDPPVGPESTIIGVFVRSQIDGLNRTTLIPDDPGPDILAPGVGTVRFGIRAGGIGGWTNDIRLKGVNEFVYCPVPWGATTVSVRSEPGWANEFTVLRGRPIAQFEP